MREYIVILNQGVDYDAFWYQIENASQDDGFVPTRRVDIKNERPGSLRSCHYMLEDHEAAILRSDPRVYDVELPPEQRTDIQIGKRAMFTGDFSKTTADDSTSINWGLKRCITIDNPYSNTGVLTNEFPYVLDGTGVDVVIQDSGLQVDHPEFQDAEGNSRVQLIDWYAESGLPGTQSSNHYRDLNGHGTHCAGIAAGKTYGWAKNARIYSVKVSGLEGSGDSGTGISISDCFDVIKLWHRNKPVDPTTGYKRPTIVNMSWGYSTTYTTVSSLTYRGSTFTSANVTGTTQTSIDNRQNSYGLLDIQSADGFIVPVRVSSVDVDLEELIAEGVHVCIAAGNDAFKIDIVGGVDYNNRVTTNVGTVYYHRGGSPYSTNAFMVGNIHSDVSGGTLEYKLSSSCTGPGVDIYAPGTDIVSTCSSTSDEHVLGNYPANSNFKITNMTGTSMASPQVCGVGAIELQINPQATPAQLKTKLLNDAISGILYETATDPNWSDRFDLDGGNNKLLYNKYATEFPLTSSSA